MWRIPTPSRGLTPVAATSATVAAVEQTATMTPSLLDWLPLAPPNSPRYDLAPARYYLHVDFVRVRGPPGPTPPPLTRRPGTLRVR